MLWKVKVGREQIAVESEEGKQVLLTTICLHFDIPVQNLSYCRPLHRGARSATAYGKHSNARNSVRLFSSPPPSFYVFKLFYSIIVDLDFTLPPPLAPLPGYLVQTTRCLHKSPPNRVPFSKGICFANPLFRLPQHAQEVSCRS